jgi:hypothetical protein
VKNERSDYRRSEQSYPESAKEIGAQKKPYTYGKKRMRRFSGRDACCGWLFSARGATENRTVVKRFQMKIREEEPVQRLFLFTRKKG